MIVERRALRPSQLHGGGSALEGDEDHDGVAGALVGSPQDPQVVAIVEERGRMPVGVALEYEPCTVDAVGEVPITRVGSA